jgi:BirA family biotin operon repressor/biotin-[acetyl-CoA-carboxylase] ligase
MVYKTHRFTTVTSTMDVCRAMAEQHADEGVVVVADEQTAGRGRVGRTWFSPAGQSLYVSILLRPQLQPHQLSWLTMIGALAVIDVVHCPPSPQPYPLGGVGVAIKWFNDVLLNGKKLAGVLVETSMTGDVIDYVILGIGLNVNTRFDNALDDVRARATSLREAFGVLVDRERVLNRLLDVFAARYISLPASPVGDYARHVDTLGKRVRLRVGDEIVDGDAMRVEDDGALVVQTDSGERAVRFGDVVQTLAHGYES